MTASASIAINAAELASSFNATSKVQDSPSLYFRNHFGRTTVDQLALQRDATVLEVACGNGAATIPAAHAVGPLGRVIAVDLAEDLIDLAKAKCMENSLRNVDFRVTDFESFRIAPGTFDAAICAFGIFFFSDMNRTLRKLWSALRPGGRLVITTWGQSVFEPAGSEFWRLIEMQSDVESGREFRRIADPASLRTLIGDSGIELDKIIVENHEIALSSPEIWWDIVLATRFRCALEHLSPSAVEHVKHASLDHLRRRRVHCLESQVLYAVATKS